MFVHRNSSLTQFAYCSGTKGNYLISFIKVLQPKKVLVKGSSHLIGGNDDKQAYELIFSIYLFYLSCYSEGVGGVHEG